MEAGNNDQTMRNRGRGMARGRGGGGRGGFGPPATRSLTAHQVVKIGPEIGPGGDNLKYTKGPAVGEAFIFYLAGDQGLPIQFTFHHPIGVTGLNAREWVCTPTLDVKYLVANKSCPEVKAWERRKAAHIDQGVLAARVGREKSGTDPVRWVNADNTVGDCKSAIVRFMAAAKADGQNESSWLEYAPPEVIASERAYKAALKDARYERGFTEAKPRFITMGGATGTIPQTAVAYLATMPLATAQAEVRKRVLGITGAASQGSGQASP